MTSVSIDRCVSYIPHSVFGIPHSETSALPHSALGARHSPLAWAGWRLEMPDVWQPLKLSGTPQKGQMIVGDAECAMFVLDWERPRPGAIEDGRRWVAERLRKLGALPRENPPAAAAFTACGWARDIQTSEGKMTTHWYGYAAETPLLLAFRVNGVLPDAIRNTILDGVLPTLRATPADEATEWAMYDVSFRIPAGFELMRRHLFSGDVALEFVRGRAETLLARQVYPGDLALGRLPPEAWLERYPFPQHRRIRRSSLRARPWRHPARAALSGIERRAWKRLPVPLGACSPRRACAVAAHDPALNRLLIAEHLTAGEPSGELCAAIIADMNAGVREGR